MRPVLITGANSFIGGHLVKYLAEQGHKVVATYRTQRSADKNRLPFDWPSIQWARVDASNWEDFANLPRKISSVVHIAGASPGPDITNEDLFSANVLGTKNVQRYALKAGARSFVYTSSMSVYGAITERTVTEHTAIYNPDVYGATKYLAERLLASEAVKIPTAAIRLPGVLGVGAHRAWIPSLVEAFVSGRDVSIYSPEAQFNNAVHVAQLNRLIEAILHDRNWQGYMAFPIGASGSMMIRDVAGLLKRNLGSESQIIESCAAKPSFLIDSSYATRQFGYCATDINEMLRTYLDDLLNVVNADRRRKAKVRQTTTK